MSPEDLSGGGFEFRKEGHELSQYARPNDWSEVDEAVGATMFIVEVRAEQPMSIGDKTKIDECRLL